MIHKTVLILVFILSLLTAAVAETRRVKLDGIYNPFYMRVDSENIYIAQGATINIYDIKSFSKQCEFGKSGEGPEEFRVSPIQNLGSVLFEVRGGNILVYSIGKTSIIDKKGRFLKEIKTSRYGLKPLKNIYIGFSFFERDGNPLSLISMFDKDQQPFKTLNEEPSLSLNIPRINAFNFRSSLFIIENDHIVVERNKSRITIYNSEGDEEATIVPDIKPVSVTEKTKSNFHKTVSELPQLKPVYNQIRSRIVFPEYYPSVSMFDVYNSEIFIITYEKTSKGVTTLIYDMEGKLKRRVKLPELHMLAFMPAPFAFTSNKFYQLAEDPETEEWYLEITDI